MPEPVRIVVAMDSTGAVAGWKEIDGAARPLKATIDSVSVSFVKLDEVAGKSLQTATASQQKIGQAASATEAAIKRQTDAYNGSVSSYGNYVDQIVKGQEKIRKAQLTAAGGSSSFFGSTSWSNTGGLKSSSDEVKKLDDAFQKASRSGTQLGKSLKEHALEPIDALRQVRDVLGLQIPQAMEKVISQSPLLAKGLMAVSGLAVFGGAASIFFETGKSAYEAYKKVSDVNTSVREYTDSAAKARKQELFDTASIESVTNMLRQARTEAEALETIRSKAKVGENNAGSIMQYGRWLLTADGGDMRGNGAAAPSFDRPQSELWTSQKDAQLAAARAASDVLDQREKLLLRQQQIDKLEATVNTASAGLLPQAAIAAQVQAQKQISSLKLQQQKDTERYLHDASVALRNQQIAQGKKPEELEKVYSVSGDSGQASYQTELFKIQQDASAKQRDLELQAQNQVIKIRQAGAQASLRGEDLYHVQSLQAADDFERQYGVGLSRALGVRAELEKKYQAEAEKRREDAMNTALQMVDAANVGGKQGIGRSQAQLQVDLTNIQRRVDRNELDPAAAEEERIAATTRAANDVRQQLQQMNRDLDESIAQSVDSQLDGFGRIEADAQRQTSRMRQHFDDLWKDAAKDTEEYAAALAKETAAESAVFASAEQKKAKLAQQNADETASIEAEARRKSLPLWHQQQQEIIDGYDERKRKLDEALAQQLISQDDYNRRVAAMDRQKNAELTQNARDLRDRLANTLKGFFDDPLGALANQAKDQMAKNAAGVLLRIGGGGIMGGGQQTGITTGLPGYSAPWGNIPVITGINGGTIGGMSFAGGVTSSLPTLSGSGGIIPTASGGTISLGSTLPGGGGYNGGSTIPTVPTFPSTSTTTGLGKAAGGVLGAAQSALGIYGASQSKSVLGGALGGALSGAQLGAQLGGLAGPLGSMIGAGVGAVGGALVGIFGDHGKSQAKQYDQKTVKPWIANELKQYESGQSDYLSAYSDFDAFTMDAKTQVQQWGSGAVSYYDGTIKPELMAAQAKLTRLQKSGRSLYGFTAAQYHTGGPIDFFGDFQTSSNEGFINAQLGEYMMPQAPAQRERRTLDAIRSGWTTQDIVNTYQQSIENARQQRMMQTVTRNTNFTVHAIDARGVKRFLKDNAGDIREATNGSYADSAGVY